MKATALQKAIRGKMPVLRYMRAQALLVHLCRELGIVEEQFDPCWVLVPQAELDRMLIRLGYAWIEHRFIYLAYHPVISAEHVRLNSDLPEWFRDGVLLARRAKHYRP